MKTKKGLSIVIIICITLFCIKSYAQSDSTNQSVCLIKEKKMIEHIVKALLDPEIMIGVFDKTDFNHRIVHLKSGDIPEMDENYLKYMISLNLIKLNTSKTIKGEFDSLIFIKFPAFAISDGNDPYGSNPVFQNGSAWLLLLEKAFNSDGSSKMEWAGQLKNENKSVFNNTTVFLNAFETYYAMCYKWPEDEKKSSNIIMANERIIKDLTAIAKILELKNKDKKIEKLNSMLKKNECLSSCSAIIVKKILVSLSFN